MMGYRCCHLTASRVTDVIVLSVLEQVAPPSAIERCNGENSQGAILPAGDCAGDRYCTILHVTVYETNATNIYL